MLKSAIKFIDPKIGRHPGEGRGPELTMDPDLRRGDKMRESNDQGAAFNSPINEQRKILNCTHLGCCYLIANA